MSGKAGSARAWARLQAAGCWRFGGPNGAFLIERDASIVRVFGGDPLDPMLEDMFVRRLLPRLVKLRGGVTYHAASLAKDGGAIMLMGPSGAGKSTTTIGLSLAAGWTILGDDMAPVWHDGIDRIAPAAAEVTVWPQTLDGIGLREQDCTLLPGYDGKHAVHPDNMHHLEAVPLRGIFFLNRADCPAPFVERCSRPEAMTRALLQVVLFNPNGMAGSERVASVARLNDTLRYVPAWQLTYPASFSIFGAVSDTISAALSETVAPPGICAV